MFLPVIKFSKVGILEHKTNKAGKPVKAIWQRYFIDILFFGLSVYGLYAFGAGRDAGVALVDTAQGVDPLLYLSFSLFILGSGLLALRFFPYFVRIIFWLGKSLWSPSVYASMIKVIRSAGQEQFIMLFLIFTVSIGIFSSQAARTINRNIDDRINYLAGADLRFRELWQNNIPEGAEFTGSTVVYFEPDFARFTDFDEVDSMTRVVNSTVNFNGGMWVGNVQQMQAMGIETRSFGETVWFRDDLLQAHMNHFLNVLGNEPFGILLSDYFRTERGAEVGATVTLSEVLPGTLPGGGAVQFTIVGFVEHWPTFNPTRSEEVVGQTLSVPNQLAIVNKRALDLNWGTRPYEIWMRTNTPTNQFIYDFIAEEGIITLDFFDTRSTLTEARSEPIIQGTNGVFTISFIIVLIVCFTGFLIYWILSIKARVLQFGIFRAMGLGMRNIISLLLNEQVLITLCALAIGVLIGEIGSSFFVPMMQASYTPGDQAIPLMLVMEFGDYVNLYAVMGSMVFISMIILTWFVARIRIDQALKLGED